MLLERLPKTVIIGASGFLGKAFLTAQRNFHPDCIGTTRNSTDINPGYLDLSSPNIASLKLAETGYQQALILAGISKISKCQQEKEFTRKINVDGTLSIIQQLVNEGIKPIYVSSDCVFDGYSGNYQDDTIPQPLNEYGLQKAEVEFRMAEMCNGKYLVIRLSKIYSLEKGDGTLLDEMAAALATGGTVLAAYDQVFCPTLISDLIAAVNTLRINNTDGVVNVCSSEVWSRYDIALEVARAMKIEPVNVQRISLNELNEGYNRPKNTSMSTGRLDEITGYQFTPITYCIQEVAKNWCG